MRGHTLRRLSVHLAAPKRLLKHHANVVGLIGVSTLLISCAVLSFAGRAHDGESPGSAYLTDRLKMASSPPPASAPSASVEGRIEVEIIVLTRFGFEPDQITRPQGDFVMAIENRSQAGDIDLSLDKVAGSRVRQQYVSREKLDWYDLISLEPGDYVLTESAHSDWVCRIKITPR